MSKVKLFPHQAEALHLTRGKNKVAYYLDMGLGKTFVASEKAWRLESPAILLVCQKSKLEDWTEHYKEFYPIYRRFNLRVSKQLREFLEYPGLKIGFINYELVFRRDELLDLRDYALILDESSYIKNPTAKRTKFIMKLKPRDVILLSGTPVGGKYEELWSQLRLLDYKKSKRQFYREYIVTYQIDVGGFPIDIVAGYKNVDRLKRTLKNYGAIFMKTEEVIDLPDQIDINIKCKPISQYNKFMKDSYCEIGELEFIGGNSLTQLLTARQLCSIYNKNKVDKFKEMIQETSRRLIVFYNFTEEYNILRGEAEKLKKPVSVVNGQKHDLKAYNEHDDSITFIQYQAGSTGLNLQKADTIIYYSPTLSAEMFMQSKKRTHRIGQEDTCYYYYLITEGTVEEDIYESLEKGEDYTNKLFEK